jgi:hypothetical protein
MSHNDTQPAFAVEIAQRADSTLVSFSGELDVASAGDMRQSLERSDVASASTVQVDLAESRFLTRPAWASSLPRASGYAAQAGPSL